VAALDHHDKVSNHRVPVEQVGPAVAGDSGGEAEAQAGTAEAVDVHADSFRLAVDQVGTVEDADGFDDLTGVDVVGPELRCRQVRLASLHAMGASSCPPSVQGAGAHLFRCSRPWAQGLVQGLGRFAPALVIYRDPGIHHG
jgi:hypothetical protein